MKWLAWWRGLLEDVGTKLASHAKLQSIMGSIVASVIMIREAIHDRMNAEYMWAYLGILVAGAAASKWIGFNKNMMRKGKDIQDVDTKPTKE